MSSDEAEEDIVSATLRIYSSLGLRPPDGKFTILASIGLVTLVQPTAPSTVKIIAVATGSKCLPASRLPLQGHAIHDSHAEILARRCAVRWFFEEIKRTCSGDASVWICRSPDGHYRLRDGILLHMYISSVPCGDASTRYLASLQDVEIAALKDSAAPIPLLPNSAARGRDNYSLYSVLRTKPGRADSPPTLSMSCSDKIASWNVLGIQGALGSRFLHPLYISRIIIGDVDPVMQNIIREDCERAFWKRLDPVSGYELHRPDLGFTAVSFIHSRNALARTSISSCNESVCWVADSTNPYEVLINGMKRGVPPKHTLKERFRPHVSKISLYQLYTEIVHLLDIEPKADANDTRSYFDAKRSVSEYQTAKSCLRGKDCPFSGWIISGAKWERFDIHGSILSSDNSPSTS